MGADELVSRHAAGGRNRAAAEAAGVPAAPAQQTVLITCMDARIDPRTLFGLRPGEVHVLRNAGGVVTEDVLRSVVISQRKLGTRAVLLVQHSGCGLTSFTDAEFSDELAADAGARPPWRPGAFTDPAGSVRDGMAQLRRDPFLLPGTALRGFVLDITRFTLDEVHD
ncbi:MAG TPA: carbonic anhydrase [Pseudonocardia sp.]|nr:carbonic anhydrase [Pseudonocardia sp.]